MQNQEHDYKPQEPSKETTNGQPENVEGDQITKGQPKEPPPSTALPQSGLVPQIRPRGKEAGQNGGVGRRKKRPKKTT